MVGDRVPYQQQKAKKTETRRGGKGKNAHNIKPKTTRESVRARATERKSEGGREGERERHIVRATERQRDRQTERQRDTETERQRDRETEGQ